LFCFQQPAVFFLRRQQIVRFALQLANRCCFAVSHSED
jgi:hypothetical protein